VGCHRLAPSPVFRFGSLRLGSGRVHRHSSRVPCPRVIINRLPRRVLPCGLLHHSRCTGISIDVARRFSVGGLIPVSLTTRNERSDSWKCLRRRSEEPTLLSWSPIRSLVKSQGCGEARGGAFDRRRRSWALPKVQILVARECRTLPRPGVQGIRSGVIERATAYSGGRISKACAMPSESWA